MIFETEERVWNIAVVGVQPGVWKATAIKELVRLGENIGDEFTARRLLKELPKQVMVKNENLDDFKKVFETVEYFHHERIVGDRQKNNRECWITLSDPDASPDAFAAMIGGLLMLEPWDRVLEGAQITLKNGVVITLDRRP
jgi:hypothetical protein